MNSNVTDIWDGAERRMPYTGDERRAQFCPVHNIKCDEIKGLQADSKKRVPVWVFTLFVAACFSIFGYLNLTSVQRFQEANELSADRHDIVVKALQDHIIHSTAVLNENSRVLSRATHALNEVAFNQGTVMEKLELEFRPITDYENR